MKNFVDNSTIITYKSMTFKKHDNYVATVTYNNKEYGLYSNPCDQVLFLFEFDEAGSYYKTTISDIVVDNIFAMEDSNNPQDGIESTYDFCIEAIRRLEKLNVISKLFDK